MAEELFDIVDENGQPLGITKTRSEAHQGNFWHRTVHIYVVNNAGQFLVHLRSPHKDSKPNCWDTRFGGHLKAGSDYLATALAELKEEIGIGVSGSDLKAGKIYKHSGKNNNEFSQIYYYLFEGDLTSLKFNDNEVVEVKWLSIDEIKESSNREPWVGIGGTESIDEINNEYKSLSK